jgi:hypothetical protein
MRARFNLTALIAVAFLSASSVPASAALVTHSTAGVLINDGFEANTTGTFPAGWTVAVRPSGTPTTADLDVENGTGTPPTPSSGFAGSPKFLALRSTNVGAFQTFGPYSTGTITTQFGFYIPTSNVDATVFGTLLKSGGSTVGLNISTEWVGFAGTHYMNANDGTSIPPVAAGSITTAARTSTR